MEDTTHILCLLQAEWGVRPPLRHIFAAPFNGGPWQHWGSYELIEDVTEELADVRLSDMVPTTVFSTSEPRSILATLNQRPAAYTHKPAAVGRYVKQTRKCLVCRTAFESRGPGERICRRCKSSSIWKEGVAMGPDYGLRR